MTSQYILNLLDKTISKNLQKIFENFSIFQFFFFFLEF